MHNHHEDSDDWILFFVDWTAKKWLDIAQDVIVLTGSIGLPSNNILKEKKMRKIRRMK